VGVLVEPGTQPPQIRTEGNVTILPILEEVLVIEKRLLVKEELRISRHATNEVADIPVAVRKQRAVVERLDSEGEDIAAISEQE
jgi:stress response protein YsnF